tara:strand:+ start:33 stop:1538 length:1506 start_codon:yes stop_codon:yes gene_type:complete
MAIKESDIKKLFKTIMQDTMKTVSAGRKTVIAPTQVRNIAKEIISEAESGSIEKFERALNRTESIIKELGVNIGDFNKGLGKRIEELRTQRDTSAKEVEKLRASNIVAETKSIKEGREYRIETNILTNQEIKQRKDLLEVNTQRVDDLEKKIIKKREKILEGDEVTQDQKEKILADEKKLADFRFKLEKEDETLNPLKAEEGERGPNSQFYEELKAPFVAVGDAFMSLKDIGMDIVGVFKFLTTGGFMKGLKSLKKGIMALGKFFMSTKVLIGLAIAGVIAGIVYFKDEIMAIGKFIMGIPGMIMDGLTKVFTMYTDFYKTMINAVIKLINKIPGVNIGLLETSSMKKEREEGEKQERIKKGAEEYSDAGEVNTQSGFVDKGGFLEPIRQDTGFNDNAGMGNEQSNVVYDKRAKSAILMNRKVVGDQLRGTGEIGTGDASTAKTLFQEQKQAKMYDTGEVPPVILNNQNKSTVSTSGTSVTGFVQNKNVDDTFTNLNYVMP